MSEPELPPNGSRTRPHLPLWVAIASILIAIASASILVYVLYKETRGPGEILREFARRVDRNDCAGSYELLDEGIRGSLTGDQWCTQVLPEIDASLDANFTLERAVLQGDVAQVEISGVPETTWQLSRFGERSWRVVGPPDGLVAPAEA